MPSSRFAYAIPSLWVHRCRYFRDITYFLDGRLFSPESDYMRPQQIIITFLIVANRQAVSRNCCLLAAQRARCLAGASNASGNASGAHRVPACAEDFGHVGACVERVHADGALRRRSVSGSSVGVHDRKGRVILRLLQLPSLTLKRYRETDFYTA